MKLKDFISQMVITSDATISITGVCDKYTDGPQTLMDECLFIEHQQEEISLFSIWQNGNDRPELRIYLKKYEELEMEDFDNGYM